MDERWTKRPAGVDLLTAVNSTLIQLLRIEMLLKLKRAKKQIELERRKNG
jgi:hypothetical protein